jgi:hypothetical protein
MLLFFKVQYPWPASATLVEDPFDLIFLAEVRGMSRGDGEGNLGAGEGAS